MTQSAVVVRPTPSPADASDEELLRSIDRVLDDSSLHASRHRGRAVKMRLVFALAVGLALAAPARLPSCRRRRPGKWWKRPRVVQLLKLTPEQQAKLEEIFARNRRAFIDLKADVEKSQIDVEELVAKKDADPKKVSAAIDALEQARSKLRKSVAMMFLDQKAVLTDQQWALFLERRDEWRRERDGRAAPRRDGAPGRDGASGAGAGASGAGSAARSSPQGAGVPSARGDPPRPRATASAKRARRPGSMRKTAYGTRVAPPAWSR